MELHWPQWVWITLATVSLLSYAVLDGKPKDGNYSLAHRMLGLAFAAWLLWCGGFFG